jgi:hypothetical protein
VVELGALTQDRSGEGWVAPRVARNSVISISGQQISVGVQRAGARVDVDVRAELLQIWHGSELLKPVKRTTPGEVRRKRASEPWKWSYRDAWSVTDQTTHNCRASPETLQGRPSSLQVIPEGAGPVSTAV